MFVCGGVCVRACEWYLCGSVCVGMSVNVDELVYNLPGNRFIEFYSKYASVYQSL